MKSLQPTNDYILLEAIVDTSSPFVVEGHDSNHFTVAFSNSDFKATEEVYVLNTLGTIKVDGKEYVVAENNEVVAHVA